MRDSKRIELEFENLTNGDNADLISMEAYDVFLIDSGKKLNEAWKSLL